MMGRIRIPNLGLPPRADRPVREQRAAGVAKTVAGLLLLSGCLGAGQDSGGEASASSAEADAPPDASAATAASDAEWKREVLNKTYRYPRAGSGSPAQDTFRLAQGAQVLEVRTRAVPECPYAYQNGARLVLWDPAGNQTTVYLFGEGPSVSTMGCDRQFNRTKELSAIAGDWRLGTAGEMMGSAQVVLVARGSAPGSDFPAGDDREVPSGRELLNRTYAYPRLGMGAQARDAFEAPEGLSRVQVRWQALPDCPVAYGRNPGFVVRDPWGRETVHRLYPEAQNASFTVDGCGARPMRSYGRDPVGGGWSLETQSEYQGSVRIVIVGFQEDS